ncbi:uncharacterized protein LOC119190278 [Manduca sexta]|uniref:uncharacterized protein LOC119190278 n=1 Tax=Manduca sexta TaxID=7130 RepID=UPI001181F6C0|nr:uncharacterized protein LOC119190278 [Manduca sexta]
MIEEKVSESELEDQLNYRECFEDNYYSAVANAESMLNNNEVGDCSNSCHSIVQKAAVKLPTISMPTFDGSFEHWLEFRDTFTSLVHNCTNLANIQKFHYLKSSLKGEAELVIHSIEFSSNNYQVAWELLTNRYNNCRLLVHNHVKALFSLQALSKESPSSIRKLIDTILKNLRALKILGESTHAWDTLIIFLIVSKLDKETERQWETHKSTLRSNDNVSTHRIRLDELISFLKDRADILETLQFSRSKEITQNYENKKQQHSKHHNISHCNVSSGPYKTSNRQSRAKSKCYQCNANHPIYTCQNFIESDLESKLKLIREHNLCENCLRSGHTPNNCRFGTCKRCNKKHNSLIHNDNESGLLSFHASALTATELPTATVAEARAPSALAPATPAACADPSPVQDFAPLTPGHFLIGRPLTAPACHDLRDIPASRLQRYQRTEQLRQHFWERWAKEYISELQVRTKWTVKKDELQPNTLVAIKDDNLPPLKWHLGRVIRTIPGQDGVARVADIRTASGIVRRSFTKICPLFQDK